MPTWLVTIVIAVLASGCDGGWRPRASPEATALWQATSGCDDPLWSVADARPEHRSAPVPYAAAVVLGRFAGAVKGYAAGPECGDACRAQLAAIADVGDGPRACADAGRLVRATSLAGYDREPAVGALGRIWLRWFWSSYWALVALGAIAGLAFGKLDGEGAAALVVGGVVVYRGVRALAEVPAGFWIGGGVVIALLAGVGLIAHLGARRPRYLGALELAVGFGAVCFGGWGLSSQRGGAALGLAVVGIAGGLLQVAAGVRTVRRPDA